MIVTVAIVIVVVLIVVITIAERSVTKFRTPGVPVPE